MYKTRDVSSARAKEVITALRAIVISKKGDICERELLEDYKELMGENVPYRELGFNDIGKFLITTGQFLYLANYKGYASIKVKPSLQSAHIAALVKKQRPGKDDIKIKQNYRIYEELCPRISFGETAHVPSKEEFFKQWEDNIAMDKKENEVGEVSDMKKGKIEVVQHNKDDIAKFQIVASPGMEIQDVRMKGKEHLITNIKLVNLEGKSSKHIRVGNLKIEISKR